MLTFVLLAAALTVAGAIANGTTANSLTKAGTGTLVLTGSSTYTGTTTINGGTVIPAITVPAARHRCPYRPPSGSAASHCWIR